VVQQKGQKSPKRLLKDLFEMKEMVRPLFFPMIYRYASMVSRIPLEGLLARSESLSRSLIMAQELFGYDAIMSNYDGYLGLERFNDTFSPASKNIIDDLVSTKRISHVTGMPLASPSEVGQVPIVLEATEQVCAVVGRDVPVMGVMNSPVTLLRMYFDNALDYFACHREDLQKPLNDAQGIVLDVVKAYCNMRIDVIWLIEENWTGMRPEDISWVKPIYETIWNVTRYYGVKTILGFHDYDIADIGKHFALGSDGVFFGGTKSREILPVSLAEQIDNSGICAGLACPYPASREEEQRLESLIGAAHDIGKGFFLSTPFEVSLDTPIEWINGVVERIKE
jgi:hypothetical protein